MSQWRVLLAIAAGGVAGALARYALTLAAPHHPGQWPWAVLAINVSGGLGIGLAAGWLEAAARRRPVPVLVRPFLVTGVLGGYTTLSAASLDTFQLLQAGRTTAAAGYLVLTAIAALLATALALPLGERLSQGQRPAATGPREEDDA